MLLSSILNSLRTSCASMCEIVEVLSFNLRENLINDIEIGKITHSSSEASDGSIFACIKGEHFDGNDFIKEAIERGARVVLTERKDVKLESGIAIISNNVRKTMAEIAKILFPIPKGEIITVGITGTKGKSTVCELIARTLRSFGVKTLSVGTLGVYFEEKYESENTTPPSSVLYPLIRRAYEGGAEVCVIEVSSQALKEYRVWGIEFDMVVFTSLGYDHIGGSEHSTFSDYISAKRSLFTSYGASIAVVNYDDPYSCFFSSGVKEIIRCGRSRGADYKISDEHSGFFGMTFSLSGIRSSYRLPGKFNANNIALAAAISKKITGKPLREILDAMSGLRVQGRFECYNILSRYAIIDYAHNEKSLSEIILAVREYTKAKIILVFGSVGDRTKMRRSSLARVASQLADFSVITSDNPGYESPYEIAEEMYSGFSDKNRAKIVVDRRDAIRYAFGISSPGDCILLLGKGHEEYMKQGDERIRFSEKDVLFEIKKFGLS